MQGNTTLGTRLGLGFGAITTITALLCLYTLVEIGVLGREQDKGAARSRDAIQALDASQLGEQAYSIIADMIINRNLDEGQRAWSETKSVATGRLEMVATMADTDQERSLAKQGKEAWAAMVRTVDQELLPLLMKGDAAAEKLSAIDARIDENKKQIQTSLKGVADAMSQEAHEADEEFDQTRKTIFTTSLVAAVIALLLGAGLAIVITRSVSRIVRDIANRLAESATSVAEAATEVAATSSELSSAATEQASSIQETASSVEEVNAMVKKNAENAESSGHIAEQSRESTEKGKAIVNEMVTAMNEINSANAEIGRQVEQGNHEIAEIVKVISEIGDKTKVINDIVFQTRLLSFNASVEAARAGEQGKGFAVVAEEVGNLAQMSGKAAQEIAAMLEGSVQKVERIVSSTTNNVGPLLAEGKRKVDEGNKVARRTDQILNEIAERVGDVSRMVSEISTASREQSQGVDEITKAVSQMDQVTQQNAAASHQAATAAEALSKEAEKLRSGVRELVSLVAGSGKTG